MSDVFDRATPALVHPTTRLLNQPTSFGWSVHGDLSYRRWVLHVRVRVGKLGFSMNLANVSGTNRPVNRYLVTLFHGDLKGPRDQKTWPGVCRHINKWFGLKLPVTEQPPS